MICAGRKDDGTPCRANALKGAELCLAHSDQVTRDSVGFGGSQPGAGRPRRPPLPELELRLAQEHAEKMLRPYWRVLGYDVVMAEDGEFALVELPKGGAKLYGTSNAGVVKVSKHDDLAAHIAASEKMRDRIYGRPKVSAEISGPAGGAVQIERVDLRQLTDQELDQLEAISRAAAARVAGAEPT